MSLNINDYQTILKYYNINYKNLNHSQIKNKAENILASKLCKCIKKVNPSVERISVPICKNSVIKKKKLHIYGFTCKKTPKLKRGKNGMKIVKYTRGLSKNKKQKRKTRRLNSP